MNHTNDCDRLHWTYSGSGYNRVRVCACGAEDHDPEDIIPHNRITIPRFRFDMVDWFLVSSIVLVLVVWTLFCVLFY